MTDDLGTLAGLIADLEELHKPNSDPAAPWCYEEAADWPCPTIELTRKHKRAMYQIIPEGSDPPEFAEVIQLQPSLPRLGQAYPDLARPYLKAKRSPSANSGSKRR